MSQFNKENITNTFRFIFVNNFKVKLVCFLLAVCMYFLIGFFQRSTKTYSTKLEIENLRDYLVVANELPETVKIIAKDKTGVFDKVTEKDFNVRLDLSEIKDPITYQLKLKWDIPSTMRSFFSQIRVEPNIINVQIDKLAEKNVEIIINSIGKPTSGYFIKRITVDPPSIRVQGPERLINRMESIKTKIVNIEGVKNSFKRQVELDPESSLIKILGMADLFFEISQETDIVSFKFQKINFQNLKKQFRASSESSVLITFKGPKNVIPNITKDDFSLFVDCANIAFPGEYTYDIDVKMPENFSVISKTPGKVKLVVQDNK